MLACAGALFASPAAVIYTVCAHAEGCGRGGFPWTGTGSEAAGGLGDWHVRGGEEEWVRTTNLPFDSQPGPRFLPLLGADRRPEPGMQRQVSYHRSAGCGPPGTLVA